ncbi:50S ribosomal protein L13 [Myxococcota bacterium]|jgi:large subunit ribosomal protein L13|nr:50S ribosomal protein L13 [Myxococcota bacterium]
MATTSFRTTDVPKRWYTVDMDGVHVGRAAARIASILRGKTKPTYTPHADTGDFVIVINAAKAVWTGKKSQALWRWHTGWFGNLRERTVQQMMETKPEFMVWKAVRGMLPKGPLGRAMLRKLKVYAGPEHPHAAQQPEPLDIKKV